MSRRTRLALGGVAGVTAMVLASGSAVAAPDIDLTFSSTGGTVLDKDGQGTGFTTQMGALDASLLDIATAQSVLDVTTSAGDPFEGNNSQTNALGVTFDGSDSYAVEVAIKGPMDLTATNQSAGVFVGAGQDEYVKVVAKKTSAGFGVQLVAETGGQDTVNETVAVSSLATATTVKLRLEVDADSGTVVGKYAFNDGPLVPLGSNVGGTSLPSGVIANPATAGVIQTHFGSGVPFDVPYDDFSVKPFTPEAGTIAFEPLDTIVDDSMIPGSQDWKYPTSLALEGNKLFVATQFGRIHVFTLDADNDATYATTITEIYNRPNYDFEGDDLRNEKGRQVTGIVLDPSPPAGQTIMYVSHSDPEIFGNNLPGLTEVDPASGIVTKLVLDSDGDVLSEHDLVTGLPRSAENHGPNGLAFGPDGWLYLTLGGNTNRGAQSNEFGYFPETPLSGTIVKMNVVAIGNGTVDASKGSRFSWSNACEEGDSLEGGDCTKEYELAGTSADDGTETGKLERHAIGFRNGYDILWHSNGNLYLNENEGNIGYGDLPGVADGCPSDPADPDPPTTADELFLVQEGEYHGHPQPVHGECEWEGGVEPIAEYGINSSTTGIAEYDSNAFGTLLKGQILSTNYAVGDSITRVKLDATGKAVETAELVSNIPGALDLAVGDDGAIFIAQHKFPGSESVVGVLRPLALNNCPIDGDKSVIDSDGDGYTDQDEIDNGKDECNPASAPADFDKDNVSDLNDDDDDGDGTPDANDQLPLDATNGGATTLPLLFEFNDSDATGYPYRDGNGALQPGAYSFFGSAFPGVQLSSKGGGAASGLVSPGGAGGFLSVTATEGTNQGASNNQDNALQVGFDSSSPFTVRGEMSEPFLSNPGEAGEGGGIFFGPGEDDFARLYARSNNGNPVLEFGVEVGGSYSVVGQVPIPAGTVVELYIDGDKSKGLVRGRYAVDGKAPVELGTTSVPASFFNSLAGIATTKQGSSRPQVAFIFNEFEIAPLAGGIPALPSGGGSSPGGSATPGGGQSGTAQSTATDPLCATPTTQVAQSSSSGSAKITLSARQLLINQRISQAAVRRANAIQARLDAGLSAEDICGGALTQADFASSVSVGGGQGADRVPASPAQVKTAKAASTGKPGKVTLSAGQLLINQRISQAAVRRLNGIKARIDGGLTGGDVKNGAIVPGKLASGLVVTAASDAPEVAASRTVVAAASGGSKGKVSASAGQLRINQKISQAAVRRANDLIVKLETGFTGEDFRDGTLGAQDLSGDLRP